MIALICVSIIAAIFFPYTMIQAIKNAVNKEDNRIFTFLSCVCFVFVIITLILLILRISLVK